MRSSMDLSFEPLKETSRNSSILSNKSKSLDFTGKVVHLSRDSGSSHTVKVYREASLSNDCTAASAISRWPMTSDKELAADPPSKARPSTFSDRSDADCNSTD